MAGSKALAVGNPRAWKQHLLVAAVLLAFGAIKLPFEARLAQEHRAAYFHGAKLNLGLREQIGQLGFLAALSGFRSIVADFLWIQAHIDWTRTEWGKMLLIFNNVTALQPRNLMFWDMSAWHMAYNASNAALEDRSQPREALRLKHQREYFEIGRDILQRGIRNNPDRSLLYDRLALIDRDKFHDHCAAAELYAEAAAQADAPGYEHRFAVYELSYCPGHEQEAYGKLLALYRAGPSEWLPTLLSRLKYLQEKLNIPAAQRVYIPPDQLPPPAPPESSTPP